MSIADVVDWFQRQALKGGYQTMMNRVLRAAMLRGQWHQEPGTSIGNMQLKRIGNTSDNAASSRSCITVPLNYKK